MISLVSLERRSVSLGVVCGSVTTQLYMEYDCVFVGEYVSACDHLWENGVCV